MNVDRCICFDVTFAAMQAHLRDRETGAIEINANVAALRERFGCGTRCALCVPYIRAMVRTGRVQFAVDDAALDRAADDPL